MPCGLFICGLFLHHRECPSCCDWPESSLRVIIHLSPMHSWQWWLEENLPEASLFGSWMIRFQTVLEASLAENLKGGEVWVSLLLASCRPE